MFSRRARVEDIQGTGNLMRSVSFFVFTSIFVAPDPSPVSAWPIPPRGGLGAAGEGLLAGRVDACRRARQIVDPRPPGQRGGVSFAKFVNADG